MTKYYKGNNDTLIKLGYKKLNDMWIKQKDNSSIIIDNDYKNVDDSGASSYLISEIAPYCVDNKGRSISL